MNKDTIFVANDEAIVVANNNLTINNGTNIVHSAIDDTAKLFTGHCACIVHSEKSKTTNSRNINMKYSLAKGVRKQGSLTCVFFIYGQLCPANGLCE